MSSTPVAAAGFTAASIKKPRKKRAKTTSNTATPSKSREIVTGEPVAETAAEAAKQALSSKKLSKKINYDALESLLTTSNK